MFYLIKETNGKRYYFNETVSHWSQRWQGLINNVTHYEQLSEARSGGNIFGGNEVKILKKIGDKESIIEL